MRELYYGDNLEILRNKIKDASVDLCYIDPPFNSKRNYNQIYNNIGKEDKAQAQAFTDTWTWDDEAIRGFKQITENYNGLFTVQSTKLIIGLEQILGKGSLFAYMVSMTLRIAEIYRVLKPSGSFYLHCDPTASHYLKLVLDGIFCPRGGNFKNEITWRRHYSHNDGNKFGCVHDVIFFYTKSEDYTYNRQYIPYDSEYIKKNYNSKDEVSGKPFRSVSLNAAGAGDAKYFGDKLLTPPAGTHWRWSQERINKGLEDGIIYFTKNGVPRYKQFMEDIEGVAVQDIWLDFYSLSSHDKERLGYPTQKPEALLERIIRASSNEGDVILDAYCGCGTTIAVAERLKRNWIGIDITYQSVSLILKRFENQFGKELLDVIKLNGLPQDLESARALAEKKDDRTRKEFEKWAVLTYSNNRAIINEKKGGDKGIDGTAFILDKSESGTTEYKQIIFSVKSDKVLTPAYIRDLRGTMDREGAVIGVLLTLYPPTEGMKKEAKMLGNYISRLTEQEYPRLIIVSSEEIIKGARLPISGNLEIAVTKSAERGKEKVRGNELF